MPVELDLVKAKNAWDKIYGENGLVNFKFKNSDETVQRYDDFLNEYDEILSAIGYNAPEIAAAVLLKQYQDTTNLKVLDIGAGSGLIGERMIEKGFKGVLDGVDGSKMFPEVVAKKKMYNRLMCKVVTRENKLDVENETYDAIISAGSFGKTCVEPGVLYDAIDCLKPGGIFSITIRATKDHYSDYTKLFDKTVNDLCEKKLVKMISKDEFNFYSVSFDENGQCKPYQGLCYCFQKV